jgi:gliding motility-associated-like protein
MIKHLYFSLCCLSLLTQNLDAQTIKRQVIGSLGTPHVNIPGTNFYTAITVAQPPNAGTVSNPANTLRQGFQQPPNLEGACPISIQYDINQISVPGCGTYYVFEYTGTVTTNTEISWNFGSEASPSLATGPVSPNVAFYEKGNTEIIITVSDGECSKTVTTMLNAQTAPFFVKNQTQNPYCYGQPGVINLTPSNGTPPYLVNWSNGAVTEDLLNAKPGTYTYRVVDQKGCVATESIELVGSNQPLLLRADVSSELCHETNDGSIEINILNGAAPIEYIWSDGATEASRSQLDSGYYGIKIRDAYGCVIDTSFRIATFCDQSEEEFIPDTFSPNGDAANELWEIPILNRFPNNTVDVYNRWGSIIWKSTGPFGGWDATNTGGEKLPLGAYYYVIQLNDSNKKVYKGSVTVIR